MEEKQIGEYIGAGLQHRVFAYGDCRVIKIPRLWMRLSATPELKQERLHLMQERIGNYLLKTEVHEYRGSYCYLQERVFEPRMLRFSDVTDLKGALARLREIDSKIRKDKKLCIDFLGSETYRQLFYRIFRRGEIKTGNIVVDAKAPHGFYLLDSDFLRTNPFNIRHPREIVFAILSFAVFVLNEAVMRLLKI